ncbi:MAG: alginate export family protein [Cyanobacteria bacterium J06626_18]
MQYAKSTRRLKLALCLLLGMGLTNPVLAQESERLSRFSRSQSETSTTVTSHLEKAATINQDCENYLFQAETPAAASALTEATLVEETPVEDPPGLISACANDLSPQSIESSQIAQATTSTQESEPAPAEPASEESPQPEPSPAATRDPMVLYDENGWTVRSHLQFGANAVFERNLYWDLAETFAPTTDFDEDTEWLELYVKPGISFTGTPADNLNLYGRLSGVASATLGTDAFDTGDTGRITLEEGHLGLRTTHPDRVNFDISVGPRELKLGTGMLIANGASNGFERGALKLGPRKAWEMAAIGRVSYGDFLGTAFYLEPNELPSNSTGNRLAGVDLRYDRPNNNYVGLTYVNVLDSQAPYPQSSVGSPPEIIPGAREGLNATNFYARVTPFQGDLEPLFLTFDAAYEWNNRINLEAWGGRAQVGYTFENAPWSPTLTYSYQTFSGDDPSTSRLERFDPLYYEGSPSSWATGLKAASVFINSNVQSHQATLRLSPSPQDTVTLRYAHVRTNELGSPVQFGQATRFDFTIGAVTPGVTDPHLSDDFFLEYSRILNRNTFLTLGASASIPGKGINDALGEDGPIWYGGFVNIVFNF